MLKPSAIASSMSGMPGPAVAGDDLDAAAAVRSSSSTTISPALGEPHDVAGHLGDGGREHGQFGRVRTPAGPPAPERPARAVTMSASPADRDANSVVALLAALHAGAGSAPRTGRTRAGAERRRPRVGAADRRWTGRAAPAGTGPSAARPAPTRQQVLHPQPARVRLSCAATAPAVRAGRSARLRVSCPATSWASRVSPLALVQPGQGAGDGRLLLAERAACSSGASVGSGRRRGAGCGHGGRRRATSSRPGCGPSRSRTARASGLDPADAARTRISVSCTRSSAAGCAPTRAPTMRRTMGIRAATSSAL